jgi:hypothetical protein
MGPLVTLAFVLAGLCVAAVGFELGGAWPYHAGQLLGWTGIVISAVAAIRQYREQRPFVYDFSEQEWKPAGDEMVLEIPKNQHRKGRTPGGITVYLPTDSGGYEEIMCGLDVTSSGTVRIWIGGNKPLSGRVVIK